MHRTAHLAAALAAVVALASCNRTVESPIGPSLSTGPAPAPSPAPLPPGIGDIVVNSIAPDSGATLIVRECTNAASNYRWPCSDQLRLAVDVEVRQNMPNAVLTADFSSCGTAYASISLIAGTKTTVSMGAIDFSTEGGSLRCPLPLDTTRITVQLWQVGAPATPLLTREFAYDYKFVMP